jgi:hypothetical protein
MQLSDRLHKPANVIRIALAPLRRMLEGNALTKRAALAVALAALVFASEPVERRFGPAAADTVLRLAHGLWRHLTDI